MYCKTVNYIAIFLSDERPGGRHREKINNYRDRIGEGHFGVHEDVYQPGEGCGKQQYS